MLIQFNSIQFNLFIKHDRSLHKLVRQGTNKNKINVLLLLLILEQVNKRHSNIFTKRTEYESQGKQIDNLILVGAWKLLIENVCSMFINILHWMSAI